MNSVARRATGARHLSFAMVVALVAGALPFGLAAPALAAGPSLILVGAVPATSPAGNTFTVTVGTSTDGTTVKGDLTAGVAFTSSDSSAGISPATPLPITGSQQFFVTLPTKPAPGMTVSRTITFTASGYDATTATILVTTATRVAFITQPGSGAPGIALGVQPRVAVQDAYGNTVTDATNTVTLSLLPPSTNGTSAGGSLAFCTSSRSAGVVTFAGCAVTAVGREYRLVATTGDLAGSTSSPFDVSARLSFEAALPTKVTAGTGVMAPRVLVHWTTSGAMNAGTRSLSDSTTVVTLGIKPGTGAAGATLTCDQAGNALRVTAGLAAFTNCRIDKIATGYKLIASASPVLTAAESSTVEVAGGAPTRLTFLVEPSAGTAGTAFAKQPTVAITDAGGNVVRTASATIFLTIASMTDSGMLTCAPSTAAATANGTASFGGCSISKPGTYTILATPVSPTCSGIPCALTPATTKAFTLSVRGASVLLAASASTVIVGQRATLTTSISPNGANRVFTLQRSLDGLTWANWLSLTTGTTGARAYTFTPSYTFSYRAFFGGASDLTAGASTAPRVFVRQSARIAPHSVLTRSVALGRSFSWATTVRPKANPVGVTSVRYYVWKRSGTAWKLATARNVTVDASGVARFSYRFGSRGSYRIRSLAAGTAYNSPSLPTTWEYVRVP